MPRYTIRNVATREYLCRAQNIDAENRDHLQLEHRATTATLWTISEPERHIYHIRDAEMRSAIAFPSESDAYARDRFWATAEPNYYNERVDSITDGSGEDEEGHPNEHHYARSLEFNLFRIDNHRMLDRAHQDVRRDNVYCLVRETEDDNRHQPFMVAPTRDVDPHVPWSSMLNNDDGNQRVQFHSYWEICSDDGSDVDFGVSISVEKPINFNMPASAPMRIGGNRLPDTFQDDIQVAQVDQDIQGLEPRIDQDYDLVPLYE